MTVITFVLFFILVYPNGAYAQNYYVKNEKNPRDGSSAVYMVNNYITPQLQLSAAVIQTRSGSRVHILASHHSGYDRFGAHTLHLFIDNEPVTLDRVINRRRDNNTEIVGFKISEDLLRKLGNAQSLRVHVRGNWSIEQDIDRQHIQRFKEFYTRHMR